MHYMNILFNELRYMDGCTFRRVRLIRLLIELNVHSNLLRLIRFGGKRGMGTYALPLTPYTVTTRMALS